MQQITVGKGWVLEIFGADTASDSGKPELPPWLPAALGYLPARLTRISTATGGTYTFDLIAAWPHGVPIPDPDRAIAWTVDDLTGALLAYPRENFHCRICGGRVNALYPDGGLPSWAVNTGTRHTARSAMHMSTGPAFRLSPSSHPESPLATEHNARA